MKLFHYCHIGKRNAQQDALAYSEDHNFFVLCDGVGGSEDGSFASQYICQTLLAMYNTNETLQESQLKEMVIQASRQLNKATNKYVATTLTLLYIQHNQAYLIHIGDSRIYYYNTLEQTLKRTKDHTIVRELFEAGILTTEREMREHPLKNRITNSLSSKEIMSSENIDFRIIQGIDKGDRFLLCSDGVIEAYTDTMLKQLFVTEKDLNTLGAKMEEMTTSFAQDNNSLILLEV